MNILAPVAQLERRPQGDKQKGIPTAGATSPASPVANHVVSGDRKIMGVGRLAATIEWATAALVTVAGAVGSSRP